MAAGALSNGPDGRSAHQGSQWVRRPNPAAFACRWESTPPASPATRTRTGCGRSRRFPSTSPSSARTGAPPRTRSSVATGPSFGPRDWYAVHTCFSAFRTAGTAGRPPRSRRLQAFIATVGDLDTCDLPPTLDVEFPGGRSETRMTPRQLLDGVRGAWRTLQRSLRSGSHHLHERPRLEGGPGQPSCAGSRGVTAVARALPVPERTGCLRSAHLGRTRLSLPVPPPWGDATNWWIHQYQGDAVGLPGFPTGNVDMNRFKHHASEASAGDRVRSGATPPRRPAERGVRRGHGPVVCVRSKAGRASARTA